MNALTFNTARSWLRSGIFVFLRIVLTAAFLAGVLITPLPGAAQSAPQATVNACGSITTTTWTSANIYVVNNCITVVEAGSTLTIQAGTVVKFGGNTSGLKVLGTLAVAGSGPQPVIFTSYKDDSAGGDTNADGSSVGTAGDWYGIVVPAGGQANIDHASIRFGGASTWNASLNGWGRAQVDVINATLTLTNSEITSGNDKGIYLEGAGLAPVVQNTSITNNVDLDTNRKFGYAVYQSTINMQPTYSGLTLTGNDRDEVVMDIADLTQDVTLGGAPLGFICGYTSCPVRVPDGLTLTIQPGAVLNMAGEPIWFQVLSGGTLLAQGTAGSPITLLESGIEFQYGSVGRIAYIDISGKTYVSGMTVGMLINSDDVQVSDSVIHNHYNAGVEVAPPSSGTIHVAFTNVTLTNNGRQGLYLWTGSGSTLFFSMDGGSISSNKYSGVYMTNGGPIYPTFKNVTISGNGAGATYSTDQWGIYANSHNVSPVLENVTISNHASGAMFWFCNGSLTARNLTATGNGLNALYIPGCTVTTGREWDLADLGMPFEIGGSIIVPSGGLLSITPGSELRFGANQSLRTENTGSLYALGTADEPILFTRINDTQGPWYGLYNYHGTMILRHVEIAYAGNSGNAGLTDYGEDAITILQNSEIHHSGYNAILVHTDKAILRNNSIHDSGNAGVIRTYGVTPVDARYNWWGDASGPSHASNPGGTGDAVGDYVLFDPWLTAPPEEGIIPGSLLVSTGAPALISPGEVTDYAVSYLNLMTTTVENAVAMIQLPLAADYLDSTDGGIYWPSRHQVFWKLGDLPTNAQGMLSARVRFKWGLAANYTDGSMTLFSGSNYNTAALDVSEYYAYDPTLVEAVTSLSQAQFNTLLAANADGQTLYNRAVADGYQYVDAYQGTFDDASTVTTAMLRKPDRTSARAISLTGGSALAITSNGNIITIEDVNGGKTTDLQTLQSSTWGSWADPAASAGLTPSACTYATCLRNCTYKLASIQVLKKVGEKLGAWLLSVPTGVGGLVGMGMAAFEAIEITHAIYVCHIGCDANPLTGCCTAGEVLWTPSALGGNKKCARYECNATSSAFPPAPDLIEDCGYGARCVAGIGGRGGCKACEEDLAAAFQPLALLSTPPTAQACSAPGAAAANPRCRDLAIRQAKDPNALYGPLGDLLPGETVNYRITYENEGAGTAYGVYILNTLPAQFDESTLVINNGGTFLAAERQLVWYIGELAAAGTGEVTYSAQLKPGLASGTTIFNLATVYFPSVPEETPTNAWVNRIFPLVAEPQELTTNYMTPLSITLSGRDIASLPLTYALEFAPTGGTLTGTLPNLTYTPGENFSGADGFTFTVSNGTSTSLPAQVYITVDSAGDTAPPQVTWVSPADGALDVAIGSEPAYILPAGSVYTPLIQARFSEALDESSLTSLSVTLVSGGGQSVSAAVLYDPALRQVTLQPLQPLAPGTLYHASLSTAVKDLAGNPLAAAFTWQFTTAGQAGSKVYLPMIKK